MTSTLEDEVRKNIENAAKNIFEMATETNKEGVLPILTSECDLVCYLFKELYKPDIYMISTEVSPCETGKGWRYDMIIYEKGYKENERYQKFDRKGQPKEWCIKKYIAVLELKLNWYCNLSKKEISDKVEEDIEKLLDISSKSSLLYSIVFEYCGERNRIDLDRIMNKLKNTKIRMIYGNLRDKKLYLINSENGIQPM